MTSWQPNAWDRMYMRVDFWRRKYRNQAIRLLGGYDQVQVGNLIHANAKLLSMKELGRKAPNNPLYPQMVTTVERRIVEHLRMLDPRAVRNWAHETRTIPAERTSRG